MRFRIWNPDEKRMYYSKDSSMMIDLSGDVYETEYNGATYDLIYSPKSSILRCLGYKDRYGAWLYEADVIRIDDAAIEFFRYGLVVWFDAGFAVKNIRTGEMWRIENGCMMHRTIEHAISIPFTDTTIIGNKFENYNLIEKAMSK